MSCTNDCAYAEDAVCDDGGSGAEYDRCSVGSDCADCSGLRAAAGASPPLPAVDHEGRALAFMSGVGATCLLIVIVLVASRLFRLYCAHRRRADRSRTFATMVQAEMHGSPQTGGLLNPPTCNWSPSGNYACFLSHFKQEAGSDARYLNDLLQRVLGATNVYAATLCVA